MIAARLLEPRLPRDYAARPLLSSQFRSLRRQIRVSPLIDRRVALLPGPNADAGQQDRGDNRDEGQIARKARACFGLLRFGLRAFRLGLRPSQFVQARPFPLGNGRGFADRAGLQVGPVPLLELRRQIGPTVKRPGFGKPQPLVGEPSFHLAVGLPIAGGALDSLQCGQQREVFR